MGFYPIGKADILAFVCVGLLVPTISEFVMMSIALIVGGMIIAGISVIPYNVILNTKNYFNMKCDPFHSFDKSLIRIVAFFMIHNKRNQERFTLCAEKNIDGKRKFCLGIKNTESEFAKDDVFVECGTPLLSYMFVVYATVFPNMTS